MSKRNWQDDSALRKYAAIKLFWLVGSEDNQSTSSINQFCQGAGGTFASGMQPESKRLKIRYRDQEFK